MLNTFVNGIGGSYFRIEFIYEALRSKINLDVKTKVEAGASNPAAVEISIMNWYLIT